jgi:hypothetical protein
VASLLEELGPEFVALGAKLKQLGVQERGDLVILMDEDFATAGVNAVQAKRLRTAAGGNANSSARKPLQQAPQAGAQVIASAARPATHVANRAPAAASPAPAHDPNDPGVWIPSTGGEGFGVEVDCGKGGGVIDKVAVQCPCTSTPCFLFSRDLHHPNHVSISDLHSNQLIGVFLCLSVCIVRYC